jgi:hypothetical protein
MAATEAAQKRLIDAFLALFSMRHQRQIIMDENGRFILVASIAGAVQRTVSDRPDIFESVAFEDELVRIVQGFLESR